MNISHTSVAVSHLWKAMLTWINQTKYILPSIYRLVRLNMILSSFAWKLARLYQNFSVNMPQNNEYWRRQNNRFGFFVWWHINLYGVRLSWWVSQIWHKIIGWWGSSIAGALGSMEYPFIAITPRSILARSLE